MEGHADAADLWERSPCGQLVTTPDGVIERANRTFLDWTQYRTEDLVGKVRFQDLLSRGANLFFVAHCVPLLHLRGGLTQLEFEIARADGGSRPMLINACKRDGSDGEPAHVQIALFDMSERREHDRVLLASRRHAEQTAEARAHFVSMISHELRTPLTGIVGATSLLEDTSTTAFQQKCLRILRTSCDAMLSLIDNALSFNKLEAGRVALDERPFKLSELVDGVVETLRPRAEERGVDLRARREGSLPERLIGDAVKLGQVLTNLVANALKFTPAGEVCVLVCLRELGAEDALIGFEVRDTGIGIPPERLARIFEPFTQASQEVAYNYGGSGLGLAISNRLLALYGSKLHVTSSPGKGSTFAFELRLQLAPARSERVARRAQAAELAGRRVLVVDDDEANRFVLEGYLKRWGMLVDTATGGAEAVKRARQQHYDLILMDLRMPEKDGFQAIAEIRASPGASLEQLPAIAMSASYQALSRADLRAAHFNAFLRKPFTPSTLLAAIRRVQAARGA